MDYVNLVRFCNMNFLHRVVNSGVFKAALNPEALKVLLKNEDMKKLVSPASLKIIMESPVIAEAVKSSGDLIAGLITPEMAKDVFNSKILTDLLTPDTVIKIMMGT